MLFSKLKTEKGFTLIELMTSISIFVIVMTISMGSILGVFDANRKSRSLKTVISNLNLTIESMSKEMRYGDHYHCGSDGTLTVTQNCPAGDTFMSFLSSDNVQTSYRLNGTTIEKQVTGGNFVAVTGPEVTIDQLTFYTLGAGSANTLQPKVVLMIKGHAGTAKGQTAFTLETLVSQRTIDDIDPPYATPPYDYPTPVVTPVTVYLTSGTTWTVPSDWNSSNNTIEVIGGGGGGRTTPGSTAGGGGGGGAYSKISNLTLTRGASVTIHVGAGGTPSLIGGDTYFNAGTCPGASVCAKGGVGANNWNGASGGLSSDGVGSIKFSGGNGGDGGTNSNTGGGGGGGAAGPNGAGKNGGTSNSISQGNGGGGGGGAGGGGATAGGTAQGGASGAGGQGTSGSGGGRTGGYASGSGTNVAAVSGGGGYGGTPFNAAAVNVSTFIHAGAGAFGIEWNSTHGAGGGGGGGASAYISTVEGNGGGGGLYGGGGGGGATGGNGAQGIIVITYTPS